jgi:hypothetical protein
LPPVASTRLTPVTISFAWMNLSPLASFHGKRTNAAFTGLTWKATPPVPTCPQ